jgi:Ca2+/Na+ antiporter
LKNENEGNEGNDDNYHNQNTQLEQEDETAFLNLKNVNNHNFQKNYKNNTGIHFYLISFLEILSSWIVYFYSFVFPDPNKNSLLCFIFVIIVTYIHTNITIFLIENLALLVNLTASFLGMTLLSWGGNVGDTINACVATKLNAPDLLTASLLGSQVINLQLCLGLPWIISMIRKFYHGEPVEVNFGKRNPLKFLLPLFIVVIASIFIMTLFKHNLNKNSGACLILIYFGYLIYEFNHNIH